MNTTTFTTTLPDDHLAVLDKIAAEQDMSRAATLRQAVRIYQLVHERAKLGHQLAFVDKDGNVAPTVPVGLSAFQGSQ